MTNFPESPDFPQIGPPRPVRTVRRRESSLQGILVLIGGMFAVAVVAALAVVLLALRSGPPSLRPVADQQIEELSTLELALAAEGVAASSDRWRLELALAPEGAEIDPQRGMFTWRPTSEQAPGSYDVVVRLIDTNSNLPVDQVQFGIHVLEMKRRLVLAPIPDQTVDLRTPLALTVRAEGPQPPPGRLKYRLSFDSPLGAKIDEKTGALEWVPAGVEPGDVVSFTVLAMETAQGGQTARRQFKVRITAPEPSEADLAASSLPAEMQPPAATSEEEEEEEEEAKPAAEQKPAPRAPPAMLEPDAADETILAMYHKNRLFNSAEYPALRKIFADRFERAHAAEIREAFGDDDEAMQKWLGAEPEIRDELYTAIDPQHDNVAEALGLFKELRKTLPAAFPAHAELAIAVAVTWDNESGIYDYKYQQLRAKSTMPEELAGPLENFRYVVEAKEAMQGRGRLLPWEFLTYVVNHRTPLAERQWAALYYLPKRTMIGQSYADVPFDNQMLAYESGGGGLEGKPYTLPNLREHGGLHTMQADFASRVAKCLGVPSAYVTGESAAREEHAWVMWVELANVAKNTIGMSVQSHGRQRGEEYYIGQVVDPQTGNPIADHEAELRLHTIGVNPRAKRHADLIMAAYPRLRETLNLDVADQLAFLHHVIRLSPGNEEAWLAIAAISREGLITTKHHRAMTVTLDNLFRTFANFPDFTWKVFDDLIAYQDNQKLRAKQYERLLAMYEAAWRPDLACQARLKYVDRLVDDGLKSEAIQGLATSILQFPGESRYVPQMLDRLEELCKGVEGSQQRLLQFYQEFLPKIPPMRENRPSAHCIEMFERAIRRFKEAGQDQLAETYQRQLTLIQAGRVPRR